MTDSRKNPHHSSDDKLESLRNLIAELGLTDALREHVEEGVHPEWDEDDVPPTFAEHAKGILSPTASEPRRLLPVAVAAYLQLRPAIAKADATPKDILQFEPRQYGGWGGPLDFAVRAAGKPEAKPEYEAGLGEGHWGNDAETVWLDCPEELIPHGLVWLMLRESDGTVITHLPKLNFNLDTKRWWFRSSFGTLFSGRQPQPRPTLYFVPANAQTRDAFLGQDVREFVASLPEAKIQRQRAVEFLASRGSEESHGH